jgi:hypothetical protein
MLEALRIQHGIEQENQQRDRYQTDQNEFSIHHQSPPMNGDIVAQPGSGQGQKPMRRHQENIRKWAAVK